VGGRADDEAGLAGPAGRTEEQPGGAVTAARAAAEVAARERAGLPRKAAIAAVARELGLRKRDVYDSVVLHSATSR
jgi:16S rRNA (cytidine1402-2'-O)-methyltransferase